ncbi:MAG: superoxide dismutase [Oscillospiraceae bacterium]|jgi:Fe-Mn family superoxide dismutase|nr:superoxide dismutase [Oscillospiraceae bacterium]
MSQHYPFELPPLPYAYDALEPYIDTLTMQLHHDRHLRAYIDNLNAALKNYPEYHGWSLERLLTQANWLPEPLRIPVKNNGGGVYNHEFFFDHLTPKDGNGTRVTGGLLDAVGRAFDGFEGFAAAFSKAAAGVFGSGYAWLSCNADGDPHIVTTANQDTLLTRGLIPLACIDVWEHAYYLKHYNVRADYIQDWFHVADWETATRCYEER